jgi:hypothetical protein
MSASRLMHEFAELVGRALARRWLTQRGLIPPGEEGPDQAAKNSKKSVRRSSPPESPAERNRS